MIVDAMLDWLRILPIVILLTIMFSVLYLIWYFVSTLWKGN